MPAEQQFPRLRQTVLDCEDPRQLAEFYRQLLGFEYRPGDDVPDPAGDKWLVLRDRDGQRQLAFQRVSKLPAATWPSDAVPQQLHLDLTVPTFAELEVQHARALGLGARMLFDRSEDEEEPLRVYADLSGHPFCIFVAT